MRSLLSTISAIFISSLVLPIVSAVTYPVGTPASETVGGFFNTYFTNMFTDCFVGEVLYGFGMDGTPHCQLIPTAAVSNATLSLSGSLVGTPNYLAKYTPTGTGINNSQVFDNGTNVGIGTATPGARLEVAGTLKVTGGNPGVDRVLTSDATGLAYWSSSIVGATATGITGGVANYVSKFGTGGIGLYPSQFFDDGSNIGIGTASPGARLDIAGTIRITGGGFASGRVLTSDATGLASWQPSVSTADFALSGAFWRQTGNSGTTSVSDYIGTADNQDLVFRRNLIEGMRLSGASSTLVTIGDARINGVTLGRGAGNIATNTANGNNSLVSNISGYQNSALGMSALYSNTIGYNNTALGYLAGSSHISGNNNIFIGYNTQSNVGDALSNQINIGNAIYGYNGNIGIGVLNPLARVDIGGNIKITDGTQGTGKVLTSDISGMATWQTPAAAPSTTTLGLAGDLIGTTNYIAKYTPTGTGINNSQLYDTGTGVGLGTTTPGARLDIVGSVRIAGIGASFDYHPSNIPCTTGQVLAWSGTLSSWICSTDAIGISGTGLTTNYITRWNGSAIANSQVFDTGTGVGIGTASPGARLEVAGQVKITGGTPGVGKILTSDATGLAYWSSSLSGATATGITGGTQNYVPKFGTGGVGLYSSQIFDTGTGVGIATTAPTTALDVNGQIRMRAGSASGYYLVSDSTGLAYWTSPIATGLSISGSVLGSTLYYNGTTWVPSTNIYNSGSNVGIGTATPSAKLSVSGSALITGDITVQGKVITDTIVNRTVANLTISGSLLPDAGAPAIYRDIGSAILPWQNLYLSNQIRIAGGSPGLGRILTSDATGLATWMTGFSGTTTASGITGGTQNYISKFGTGGTGLYPSQMFDTGTGVGIGTTSPTTLLDVNGQIRLRSGSASGSYLISDALGVASWTTAVTATAFNLPSSVLGSTIYYNGTTWVTSTNIYNSGSNVGIGTATPGARLEIAGQVKITGGTPGLGKILTSDATGLATWSSTLSGATATGITGGVQNYVTKFGTGGVGLYTSQIFDNGTNIGFGTSGSLTTKVVIDSGIDDDSGLRLTRIDLSTPLTANNVLALGVNASGKVMPISPISNIAVYTGTLRSTPPTPNPDLNTFNVSYDFNQYFAIPGKQSFVVSKGDGPSNNGPYFKENGTDALCSITGTYGGPGAYDCANPDPVTGISASPYNSFTMSAKGDTFGYQLALGARGDAPLFARSGRFNGNNTGGLYTNDSPYQTPAPWQRVLSIPANHNEYLYINTGLNSQLQAISGGGQIGMGTSFPDRHVVIAGSPVGSTSSAVPQLMIRRGVQGADSNLGVAYGTPYLNIGGLENRVTALQTIGFGYSGLAGTTRYAPAEIGFITTSTTGNTQGDIVFANRNGTTNVAPVEVVRITSNGSVGIGTPTPATKIDVAGTFRLGVNGTSMNALIKAAPTVDIASINSLACLAQTFAVTNAVVGGIASISPASALTNRMIIAYARVSAANTVEAKFCNESTAAINLPSMVYYISVIQ